MRQVVAHARAALCHAIAHANGVELDGLATGLEDSLLYLGRQLAQGLMPGAQLVLAVGNGNERLVRVLERINRDAGSRKVCLGDGPLEGLKLVNCSLHGNCLSLWMRPLGKLDEAAW